MTLSEWVKLKGLKREWLAEKLDISICYVSSILSFSRGKNNRVKRISQELALKIVQLTDGDVTLQEALFPQGLPGVDDET